MSTFVPLKRAAWKMELSWRKTKLEVFVWLGGKEPYPTEKH